MRVAGRFGISNPRSFEVGTRKETQEVEPNDVLAQATPVELSTVVNARSNKQADVDMYKFQGRKGQRVIVECRAVGNRFAHARHDGSLRCPWPPSGDGP